MIELGTELNMLSATCWCERTTLMIPVQWVSEARTGSCGDGCGPGCPARTTEDDPEADDASAKRRTIKMKRFNAGAYDPRTDSSFGYAHGGVRVEHPDALILEVGSGDHDGAPLCACGCGEMPRGKGATFGMGHDARLRGKLARAEAASCKVVLTNLNHDVTDVVTPLEYAGRFSTAKLDWQVAVRESAARASRSRGEEAEREILARALGPQIGETKLIKVGRWEKTGRVVAVYSDGAEVLYEYADSAGNTRRARQDADGKIREVAV